MTPPACRLLPLMTADGPTQMAADEVMLESAAAGVASLRFYFWQPATVSLGYFQPADLRLSDPLLAPMPWVRRSSGGAALVHDREVTYCLALPAGRPWHSAESWTCRFHHVIRDALAPLGVGLRPCVCGEEQKLDDVLCFLHHTPGDLLIDGHKVVGSAQRRQRGAVMQHGGILLAQSEHTPRLPGIRELAGVELTPDAAAGAVSRTLADTTGFSVTPADWTDPERQRIEELAATKYGSPAWNHKR